MQSNTSETTDFEFFLLTSNESLIEVLGNYVIPLTAGLGTLFNMVIIFTAFTFTARPVVDLVITVGVADTVTLLYAGFIYIGLHAWKVLSFKQSSDVGCKIATWLIYMLICAAQNCLLLLTIDRSLLAVFPQWYMKKVAPRVRYPRIAAAFVYVSTAAMTSHSLKVHKVQNGVCLAFLAGEYMTAQEVSMHYGLATFNRLGPIAIMVVLNMVIACKAWKLAVEDNGQNEAHNTVGEKSITYGCLAASVGSLIFLFSGLAIAALMNVYILPNMHLYQDEETMLVEHMLFLIGAECTLLSMSSNLISLIIASSEFRANLLVVFSIILFNKDPRVAQARRN